MAAAAAVLAVAAALALATRATESGERASHSGRARGWFRGAPALAAPMSGPVDGRTPGRGEQDMRSLVTAGAAVSTSSMISLALSTNALAGGFARFTQPTDAIRVEGDITLPSVDMTYEARLRISPASPIGRIITEQADSYEDKHVAASRDGFNGYFTRGLFCGHENTTSFVNPLDGEWHHVAFVRKGMTSTLYIDGTVQQVWTESTACTGNAANSSMSIGAFTYGGGHLAESVLGDIDWIRVSSVARYTTQFKPPPETTIESDTATSLLLKFNEAPSTLELIDEGPGAFVCRLGIGTHGYPATAPHLVPHAEDSCPGDLYPDGTVNGADLGILLSEWGEVTPTTTADLNRDGAVDGADLGMLLVSWGPCPNSNVPAWATVLETQPDPAVVTDPMLRAAITATGLPWRVQDTGTGIEMLLVPPGTFQMGCSASDHWGCWAGEYPVHPVTISTAFYMGRYEVTQAQWQAGMGSNPAFFSNSNGHAGSDDRPVEMVSWNDAQGFLMSTGMRLPTEAEWEYAYRAGTTTAYHGWAANPGGTNNDGEVGAIGWYIYNTCYADGCGTRAVGLKAANGFGLQDMLGNVSEFVSDWYGDYEAGDQANPTGPVSGTQRVIRGGCWFNSTPSFNVRSSFRIGLDPDRRTEFEGFRVARNP